MDELPKLIEIPKERIIKQFESGKLDIYFIADYIEKLDHSYNLLIDRYNNIVLKNNKLKTIKKELSKGLITLRNRSMKWKERYYRERKKVKEMKQNDN